MKKILIIFLGLILGVLAFAHAPLLAVDDMGDGTIFLTGGYSNDESAAGTPIIIVQDRAYNGPEDTFKGKMIIFKGVLDEEGTLTVPKPKTSKYEVYFDGGEGHVLGKKGPELLPEQEEKWEEVIVNYDLGDWKEFMTAN